MDPTSAVAGTVIVSIAYLILIALVLWTMPSAMNKLIVLGLLTAVASVLYGSMGGGASVQAGGANVNLALSVGGIAGSLMKIATVLVLGGVAAALWPRANQ